MWESIYRRFGMFRFALMPLELILKIRLGIPRAANYSQRNLKCLVARHAGCLNGSLGEPFGNPEASRDHESS